MADKSRCGMRDAGCGMRDAMNQKQKTDAGNKNIK